MVVPITPQNYKPHIAVRHISGRNVDFNGMAPSKDAIGGYTGVDTEYRRQTYPMGEPSGNYGLFRFDNYETEIRQVLTIKLYGAEAIAYTIDVVDENEDIVCCVDSGNCNGVCILNMPRKLILMVGQSIRIVTQGAGLSGIIGEVVSIPYTETGTEY